jgi:hypothetical protein
MSVRDADLVKAAARLRDMELELGKMAVPFLNDRVKMNEIALKAGMRTGTLIELALVAAGIKRRHRAAPAELK